MHLLATTALNNDIILSETILYSQKIKSINISFSTNRKESKTLRNNFLQNK